MIEETIIGLFKEERPAWILVAVLLAFIYKGIIFAIDSTVNKALPYLFGEGGKLMGLLNTHEQTLLVSQQTMKVITDSTMTHAAQYNSIQKLLDKLTNLIETLKNDKDSVLTLNVCKTILELLITICPEEKAEILQRCNSIINQLNQKGISSDGIPKPGRPKIKTKAKPPPKEESV